MRTNAHIFAGLLVAVAARAEPAARTEGVHVQVQVGQTGLVALHLSPDGERALSVGDGLVLVWDLASGQVLWSLRGEHGAWLDPTTVVVSGRHGAHAIDIRAGAQVGSVAWPAPAEDGPIVSDPVLSADGRYAAWTGLQGFWRIDLLTAAVEGPFRDRGYVLEAIAAGGRHLAVVDVAPEGAPPEASALVVLDLVPKRPREVLRIPGVHPDSAFSADGATFGWTAGADRRVAAIAGGAPTDVWAGMRAAASAGLADRVHEAEQLGDGTLLVAGFGWTGRFDPAAGRWLWFREARKLGTAGVAIAPDGRTLAASDTDGNVAVWDLATLSLRRVLHAPDEHGGGWDRLAWSPDGGRLLGWRLSDLGGLGGAAVWDQAGRVVGTRAEPVGWQALAWAPDGRVAVATDHVTIDWWEPGAGTSERFSDLSPGPYAAAAVRGLAVSPDGRWLVALTEPDVVVYDALTGAEVARADVAGAESGVAIAPDGASVVLSGAGRTAEHGDALQTIGVEVRCTLPELACGPRRTLDAALTDHLATSAGGARVALGGSGGVVAHHASGEGDWLVFPSPASSVAVSPDGRIVAYGGEGTGAQLWLPDANVDVGLFATADGEWAAWSSDGYFDASRDGTRLLALVEGLDAYAVDQVAVLLNRPDVLLERLGTASPEVVAHYRAHAERRLRKAGLPPEARLDEIHAPSARIVGRELVGRELTIEVAFADPEDDLARFDAYVNGVPVWAGGRPIAGHEATASVTVILSPGENEVEISATDVQGRESRRDRTWARWDGRARGALWYVGLGVSAYEDASLRLDYAHQDALDLGAAIERMGGAFDAVHARTWTDGHASRAALGEAAEWLAGVGEDDTVVVFAAGHGLHDRDGLGTYYFLTVEARTDDLSGTAAPFEALEGLLRDVPARKKLLLLDTCESGEVEEPVASAAPDAGPAAPGSARGARVSVARPSADLQHVWADRERFLYADLTRRTGAIVLSSSRGGEPSFESSELANGYFTEEILAALATTVADADRDGIVTSDELRVYVARAVAERSAGRQNPTADRDNDHIRIGFPIVAAP